MLASPIFAPKRDFGVDEIANFLSAAAVVVLVIFYCSKVSVSGYCLFYEMLSPRQFVRVRQSLLVPSKHVS